MIEATGLAKKFDDFVAVRDLDLHVAQGELLALLGPNGAGKTTTVRMLGAILRPSAGTARVNGFDVVRQATEVRRSIGMLTEQPGLYPRMSGLEYLTFYGRIYGLDDEESRRRTLTLFERFGMPDVAQRRLGTYSKGMRQKVGLIRSMLHDPAVLLLDEPTSAMDPYSARLVRDAIHVLRRDRRSIILCTHNLAEAEELADRIAIISQGKIVCVGTDKELKQRVLGPPLFELHIDAALNGRGDDGDAASAGQLGQIVDIVGIAGNVIRFRADRPQEQNPLVVRKVSEMGAGVVSLRERPRSLEEVYLKVLGDDAREAV